MNIVYNASAGTGKTYQVTRLYERLVLEDGIDPRKILLMTFTDNAAAELRMRVAHRLLKARRTAEAAGEDDLAERAALATSHLPSAPIGTIHSFCTRLLREHALEAGLSPGFSVLVGDDRDELLNQICRDELLARLASDPDFKTFCSGAHIIGTGNGFGTSITETVPGLISQADSLGISLENTEAMLPDPRPAGSLPAFTQILNRLHELPKLTADARKVAQCLEGNLPKAKNVEALAQALQQAGLKKFGRGKGQKPISDDFWELLTAVADSIKYRERHPAAKAFARFLQAVTTRFQQRKHEMDAVDFDDQLRMAARLLKTGKAVPEFDYVIVDEVQDTSRIQCELIECLWSSAGTGRPENKSADREYEPALAATNLVICGDKKQSIYTWRGADPQVMPDLETAIAASGHSETIPLQTSYRSKAPILDVVNTLFASVYGAEAYSPADNLQPNPDFNTDDEKPCVEFLAPDGELAACSKQEKVAAEMAAVANRIQLLINGPAEWKPNFRHADGFLPTAEQNDYRYSDILILLRRTSHQPALEQALRHAGIPYTLGGKGRGLFTRQETRDVSLLLNVVTNPNDAYSLVGFLRSPWVGLSDEAIAELAWSKEGFSADNLLANYASATDIVDRYRELLGTRLASELVRMLIDETGYDALLAGLPRGTQRLANLRKVLDWLRETERGAQTTPAAVARKLTEQIANPPQVPEAALLDPAQNAVTIMTVHGAKGLTKRVVFVPDISFRPDSDRGFSRVFFDEQHAPILGIKITAPDKSSVASPGFKAANTRAKADRDHELNNLFYVAMTRARDLVVTSASAGKKAEGWLGQLEPLVTSGDIPAIPYSTLSGAADIEEHPKPEHPDAGQLAAALETLPPPPEKPSLQRIPATRLAKEQDELEPVLLERTGGSIQPGAHAAALGTLGHAVLEQLALNNWEGSVNNWLETLRDEFEVGKPEADALAGRIEQTRDLMSNLTTGMPELQPEFPFVLHEGDTLIDGTIDLLCRTTDGFAIFDYKFTEANDESIAEAYRSQMNIYQKAAERVFPETDASSIQLVVVSEQGPRLVEVL
jgi:ATP-dependent helicase/nuclease subunit A